MGTKSARYDEEFKEHAVKMVVERNRSITEVASDLGVSQPTIRRWVKERTEPGDSANRRLAELAVENKKLKRKSENAEETIDVLEKSVAIFVNP